MANEPNAHLTRLTRWNRNIRINRTCIDSQASLRSRWDYFTSGSFGNRFKSVVLFEVRNVFFLFIIMLCSETAEFFFFVRKYGLKYYRK